MAYNERLADRVRELLEERDDVTEKAMFYLGVIPDSLRTAEQKQLIKLINEVSFKYMSVENNHMVFKLTREEYLAKGIPERYYVITSN